MNRRSAISSVMLTCLTVSAAYGEEPAVVAVVQDRDRLRISVRGRPFADYVFRDAKLLRPYFANVHAPGGVQVTRHHPPRKGTDSTDHATMHPGIWLAFGDISGADFWRNKARVEHVKFVEKPTVGKDRLTFVVLNRYRRGVATICTEVCRHTLLIRPHGYLLTYDSKFRGEKPFTFGDQEELGLGFRIASKLRVKGGNGRIFNADGKKNEREVRGTNADWCDYGGTIDGKRAGIVLMPHPDNFRKSWYHARNYGFLAANPFGRNALTGGERSKVTVMPGSALRLRFAVFIYAIADRKRLGVNRINAVYRDYLRQFPGNRSRKSMP